MLTFTDNDATTMDKLATGAQFRFLLGTGPGPNLYEKISNNYARCLTDCGKIQRNGLAHENCGSIPVLYVQKT